MPIGVYQRRAYLGNAKISPSDGRVILCMRSEGWTYQRIARCFKLDKSSVIRFLQRTADSTTTPTAPGP